MRNLERTTEVASR